MKRALLCAAVVLATFAVAHPVWAQAVTRDSQCTEMNGTNKLTYDCGFNVKNYSVGAPVTFNINWSCTGTCGGANSFGLRQSGFSPSGVSGHMMGAKVTSSSVSLTFAFDSLKKTGGGYTGNAHFVMGIMMDDGSGTMSSAPCNIDVHLQE